MDAVALVFVGCGSAVIGAIGGHLLTNRRNATARRRLGERNADLSMRLKRALDGERDARAAADRERVQRELIERREKALALRILALRDQLEERR